MTTPTTTQQLDWYDPRALHTRAYERHLIVQLIHSTVSDVVAQEDVAYDALLGILDRRVTTSVDWTTLPTLTTLGIDEIALTRGHRNFVAVLTGRAADGTLHLLAVLPDHLQATVVTWLQALPVDRQAAITTVCTDMWEGYVTAVQKALPHATIVIDRFHVARHYRDAVDDLRTQEVRRLRQELPEAERDQLKRTLWPFRERTEALTDAEQPRLDTLRQHSPALQTTYTLREELTAIFDTARSKAAGLRRIRYRRQRVGRSGLTCFDRFLTLLDTWQNLITNHFTHHDTSGFVEGLNNKLKVLTRRCYGLRSVGRLFQRLTLDLDGYRRFSPWRAGTHYIWAPPRLFPKNQRS